MLTYQKIAPYLTTGKPESKHIHQYYQESIDLKELLKEVFGDKYPSYMDINRPGEKKTHKTHRKKIYTNPFRSMPRRISEVLDYIRQADDYSITFPAEIPKGIKPEESLKSYTENKALTAEGDFETFFFKKVIPQYVRDPNAVLVCIPKKQPTSKYEFVEPVPILFPCENVLMHRKGEFAALVAPFKNKFIDQYGREQEGVVMIFLDHESYSVARQVAKTNISTGQMQIEWEIDGMYTQVLDNGETVNIFQPPYHYCKKMPAQKIGKIVAKENDYGETYCESILSDSIPFIKGGQQTWNDKEIEKNQHLSSQEYRYVNKKCNQEGCHNGTIIERNKAGKIVGEKECPKCKGSGLMPSGSGLDIWLIDSSVEAGDGKSPASGVPGGFIPRSIEPYIQLSKDYDNLKKEVLTTLNMQYVINTNTDASGTSKRYDREEGYREVNTQGAHLLDVMSQQYETIENMRYGVIKRSNESQVPSIIVPIRLNLENAELTREELKDAKSNNFDPAIVEALERKLIQYNVGENSDIFKRYETKVMLDPFRSLSLDQKNMAIGLTYSVMKDSPERTSAIKELLFSVFFDSLIVICTSKSDGFYKLDVKGRNEIIRKEFELMFSELHAGNVLNVNSVNIKPAANLQDENQTV
ncbi:hypothetical protein [Runella zeae]|uniref:hypothetical protein n=1 Tax=Runella zeae TaxID=94255 RepID=UPI0004143A38|nr:hypothetical protein [Runella zeae]